MGELGRLHIDLFNFEDEKFEGNNYVLTCPQSLEACSRLGIKPVELLSKSISEFKEEYLPRRLPIRLVYSLYKEHERERQNKLHLCIEEWQKIVNEENTNVPSNQSHVTVNFGRSASVESGIDDISESEFDTDNGSVERARTAWNTSVGHTRVTMDEINRRATDLCNAAKKSVPSFGDKKGSRGRTRRSRSNGKGSRDSSLSISRTRERGCLSERGYYSRSSRSSDRQSVSSLKYSDAGSVTSDKLSSRSWDGLSTGTSQLKAKDQKIIALMAAKIEKDRQQRLVSEKAHRQWEHEQERSVIESQVTEAQRRQQLLKNRLQQENERNEIIARRQQTEEIKRQELSEIINTSQQAFLETSNRQLQIQRQKRHEKQLEDANRRTLANLRLEQKLFEDATRKNDFLSKQLEKLDQAHTLKAKAEVEQIMRTRCRNEESEKNHKMKVDELAWQSMNDQMILLNSINVKHHHSSEQLKMLNERRARQLRQRQQELNKKIKQSRMKQLAMEEELQQWHENMDICRKMQEVNAEKAARETVAKKSQMAYSMRTQSESRHKENLKRLWLSEEQARNEMAAVVAFKGAKIQALQADREQMIQEARGLAGASQRMRELVKSSAGSLNDLDQLGKRAELENHVLFRSQRYVSRYNSLNASSVTLG